jgi:hypothetical protein
MSVESAGPAAMPGESRVLTYVALVYAGAFFLYNGDRFRRGLDSLTVEAFWVGTISGVVAIVAITLAVARDQLAPPAAMVHGFAQALYVAVVHVLPTWSGFSDSLLTGGADGLSWTAVVADIVGALALGAAGALALRRRSRRRPTQMTRATTGRHGRSTPVPLSEVRSPRCMEHCLSWGGSV